MAGNPPTEGSPAGTRAADAGTAGTSTPTGTAGTAPHTGTAGTAAHTGTSGTAPPTGTAVLRLPAPTEPESGRAFTSANTANPEGAAVRGRRRKWLFAIIGGVVLLAAGTAAWAVAGRHQGSNPAAAPSGVSANEGVFAFVVGNNRCDVHSVGPADLTQLPKGVFCLVDVAVTNNGTEAELLDGGPQRAVDAQGHEYPVADGADVFLNSVDPTILNEIEPGTTVHGTLAFDVPPGTRITALMLHESMSSKGVRVPLS